MSLFQQQKIFQYSATELAVLLQNKEISAVELVETYIQEIQSWNPYLNALVAERFEQARKEAKDADIVRAKSKNPPPFLGVPCTIKEAFALQDMPQSSGLPSRKEYRATQDAPTVQALRRAGFIPLGVTNTSELCMWLEANNQLYGRTNNPYDLGRTSGGSSGGEGALIGAGLSPIGLGSDIGGSIRIPAFFNGIFGHKPSAGLVANDLQFPIAENKALDYLCSGPMCRKAEDLFPLLQILAGEKSQQLTKEEVDWKTLKIISIQNDGLIPVSSELQDIQEKACQYCEKKGATIEKIQLPALKKSILIWLAGLEAAADTTFAEQLFEGESSSLLAQWFQYLRRKSGHTFPALGLATIETMGAYLPNGFARYVRQGEELRQQLEKYLTGNTLLFYPSHGVVAPKHNESILRPWRWSYTAIMNTMLLPSTQVPLGLNQDGLPLGMQVLARHGADAKTIAMAEELEKGFGGWVSPNVEDLLK